MQYQTHFKPSSFPYKDIITSTHGAFPNHCHKELEIIHVRKGKLSILYNQKPYVLEEGMIAIIPPYINHALLTPSTPCERFVIELDIEIAEGSGHANTSSSAIYQKYFYNVKTLSCFWSSSTYAKVKALIYNMHEEYLEQKLAWEFSIKTFTNLLILTAIRDFPRDDEQLSTQDANIEKLQNAVEYIATHYTGQISLDECASLCDFSPSYFSRYFKKNMGITFQEYIKNTRIEHAKWLLITTSHSITEIALQSGFSDIRVFNKLFKETTKMTATQYRKNAI